MLRFLLNGPGVALLSPVDETNPPLAVIYGLSGLALTPEEEQFFKSQNPLGFILFARNIDNPAQLSALTKSLKTLMGREVPILIDQEGGRVARMRAPNWVEFPPAKTFGDIAVNDMARARKETETANRGIASMLQSVGINVNCTPVLDIAFPQTHAVIGDRAFSSDPAIVGELGAAVCEAHLAEGVIPVVKHIPGHGRATADSHLTLPVVDCSLKDLNLADLAPYRAILSQKFAKAVWGMVAHVVYSIPDPANPATCSPAVMGLIRQDLGFDGFLLSDDIVMNALAPIGDMGQRAAATLSAGCDAVLHCNGVMAEMKQVAASASVLSPDAVRRFNMSVI